jgi:hypothetical protein
MKKVLILIVLVLLLFSAVIVVAGNSYSIPWWSIDGGAQTSSGDGFSLSGIAGQPDAGLAMTGGDYGVTGGYWSAAESEDPEQELKVYLPFIVR